MTTMPASFWEKKGEKMALRTFHEAAEKVPAYKDFLKKHNVDPKTIQNLKDFQEKVPISSKKNFLHKYSLADLTGKEFDKVFGICFSSGSTGIPTPFLYRRKIFFSAFQGWLSWLDYMWDICSPSNNTLFINTTPLGVWSFGYTINLLMGRVLGKYNITYVTTGCDSQMVLKILKEVGENYSQVIISTIPSFLRKILDEGDEQGIKWEKLNLKLQLGGEYLSEDFQEYILSKIDPERKEGWRIFNLLAAGDTGLIGFTPLLPMIIQKIAKKDEKFRSILLDQKSPFSLFQYNPLSIFLEEKEDNLLVTATASLVPIIRYKIGDSAKIVSFSEMEKKLKSCGYTIPALLEKEGWQKGYFKWPFLIFLGRSDDMITIFSGAKISPQNLSPLLNMPEAKEIKSFKLTTQTNKNLEVKLVVYLELKPNLKPTPQEKADLERKYQNLVHQCLLKTNIDYQDAYRISPDRVLPQVKIFLSGQGLFQDDISRPKPKMVI
ncbi:MAG: phenylacetate--CoA ligase family protein [Minisyncoccales bacterium]